MRDSIGNPFTKATVTYTSSSPSVAIVSSTGAVTATAVGSTTIKATATADGVTVTDSVAVKVVDASKVRIYAEADTYVQSSTPTTNYGTQYGMLVKPSVNGSADRAAYVRFDLSPLAGKTVTSAKLTTESVISDGTTSPSTIRVDAHSATGSWSETGLTYAGRPALGPTLGSFTATRTKATASTDLTSSIKTLAANRTGSLTLGLTEDNPGTDGPARQRVDPREPEQGRVHRRGGRPGQLILRQPHRDPPPRVGRDRRPGRPEGWVPVFQGPPRPRQRGGSGSRTSVAALGA